MPIWGQAISKKPITLTQKKWHAEEVKICHRTGLKRNDATFCGLVKARLLFLGLWVTDSLSDVPQSMNSSHSTLWRLWSMVEQANVGLQISLNTPKYLRRSCCRGNGSSWQSIYTGYRPPVGCFVRQTQYTWKVRHKNYNKKEKKKWDDNRGKELKATLSVSVKNMLTD